jgi:hypothetical protein
MERRFGESGRGRGRGDEGGEVTRTRIPRGLEPAEYRIQPMQATLWDTHRIAEQTISKIFGDATKPVGEKSDHGAAGGPANGMHAASSIGERLWNDIDRLLGEVFAHAMRLMVKDAAVEMCGGVDKEDAYPSEDSVDRLTTIKAYVDTMRLGLRQLDGGLIT